MRLLRTSYVIAVAVTADGRMAVFGSGNYYSHDKTLQMWDILAPSREESTERQFGIGVCVAQKGKTPIVTAGKAGGNIHLWDLSTGRSLGVLPGHNSKVNRLVITHNGRVIAAGADGMLRIWNIRRETCEHVLEMRPGAVSVAVTPDEVTAVLGSGCGKLQICDLRSGRVIRTWKADGTVSEISLSLDGRFALALGTDSRKDESGQTGRENALRVFDICTGHCLCIIQSRNTSRQGATLALDGRSVISATREGMNFHFLDGGSKLVGLPYKDAINCIAATPDGRFVVTGGSSDGTVRLWSLSSRECVWATKMHHSMVTRILVRSDGRVALTGGNDTSLHLWDVANGQRIASYDIGGGSYPNMPEVAMKEFCCTIGEELHLLELVNGLTLGPPIVTATRIWSSGERRMLGFWSSRERWDAHLTVACAWCCIRFRLPPTCQRLIEDYMRPLTSGGASYLSLNSSAWADRRLLSKCPKCRRPLRFNPFAVDNRERCRSDC
jgi:WD40 repeat protein